MAFSTFAVVYSHHYFLFPEHFHHHPKRKPARIKGSLSISPSSQPLATINMLSISVDLPILYNFIWIWNHTICGTLSLLLSLCMFLKLICPLACIFISFYSWIIVCCVVICHNLCIHSSIGGHLSSEPVSGCDYCWHKHTCARFCLSTFLQFFLVLAYE